MLNPGAALRVLAQQAWHHLTASPIVLVFAFGCALVGGLAVRTVVARRHRDAWQGARRLRILPPVEVDPEGAQVLWKGLHTILRPRWRRLLEGQTALSWEITARAEDILVDVLVPQRVPPGLVERAIAVAFPGCQVIEVDEDPFTALAPEHTQTCELGLAQPEWFAIADAVGAHPMGLMMGALHQIDANDVAGIQVLVQPAPTVRRAFRYAARRLYARSQARASTWWDFSKGRNGFRTTRDPGREQDVRAILDKADVPAWSTVVRLAWSSPNPERARGRIHALGGAYGIFEGRNGFRRRRWTNALPMMKARRSHRPYLLSVPELAQLATLPAPDSIAGLESAGARTMPPPKGLPTDGKVLGVADHLIGNRSVGISVADARHHLHVIGQTGTGKSTLLVNLVLQDAQAGRAAVVIDPKGDMISDILARLPASARDRLCVIDPDDKNDAVGLNVLAGEDDDLVVDHVLGVFKRIYEPYWGPRTDDIMRAACLTLRKIPGATLAEVPLLLSHHDFRVAARNFVAGTSVGLDAFWKWFEALPERERSAQIAPLLNKLRAFLLRAPVRCIVGQAEPKLDIQALIDSGGLLLVRIPKGTLGEDTSRLLGAFVIARIWQACLARAGQPEEQRRDLSLYVDEMHNYLALPRSFEDLLAEARGYRLSLVLAHQHLGQLPREMRDALDANARTKVVFACSPDDARQLERHFRPQLSEHDLSHLSAHQVACRPCVNGGHRPAFTLRTTPLSPPDLDLAKAVRAASAASFGVARPKIEEEILNRHNKPVEKFKLQREDQHRGPQRSQP